MPQVVFSTYEAVVECHLDGLIRFGLWEEVLGRIVSCSRMSVDVGRLPFSSLEPTQLKTQCLFASNAREYSRDSKKL